MMCHKLSQIVRTLMWNAICSYLGRKWSNRYNFVWPSKSMDGAQKEIVLVLYNSNIKPGPCPSDNWKLMFRAFIWGFSTSNGSSGTLQKCCCVPMRDLQARGHHVIRWFSVRFSDRVCILSEYKILTQAVQWQASAAASLKQRLILGREPWDVPETLQTH